MYEKEIIYDPETRDFAMYLYVPVDVPAAFAGHDGELVGFARTYQEAEQTLDELIYELLNGTHYVPIKGQHGTSPAA